MGENKYALGVDYGTKSGRALLMNVRTGEEIAEAVLEYPHGVMDERLPDCNVPLEIDWALQHPADHLEVLKVCVPKVLKDSGVAAQDVIGIGIDFTSCSMLPVDRNNTPLCFLPEYCENPHAYMKLWKHHAAQPEADEINRIGREMGEPFLDFYGGKLSAEWMLAKSLQIANEAPEIYDAADLFMEAGDFMVATITGERTWSNYSAGFKTAWNKRLGFPSKAFFKRLNPKVENLIDEKFQPNNIRPVGSRAGLLNAEWAGYMGLCEGTPVAVAIADAPASMPTVGAVDPGLLMIIMGTSSCHMVLSESEQKVPGICGVVEDALIPGYFGYEAGQPATGDLLDWFVTNCVPQAYEEQAQQRGINIHTLLTEKAQLLRPGESGLVALDWLNGNRTKLIDSDLTGMVLGLTLLTKPEEIYRALIEATAFGTRIIVDNFERNGVPIKEIRACGGIARKNEMMMQIYADVTGREIKVSTSKQSSACGAAMYGAVAAGAALGGYDSIQEASHALCKLSPKGFHPNPDNSRIYEKIFEEYQLLHDYFGTGINDVMKRLKTLRQQQRDHV